MITELEKILKEKGYKFYKKNGVVTVTHKGCIDLDSLTSITTDVIFNNQGNIYLDSLTSITTDVIFNNQGNIYLDSLTSITTDVIFNNQGYIYLDSLTSITTDVIFNNQGYIYLDSLTSITTRGKKLTLKQIDGYTMIIESEKKKDDFIIYKAIFMGGGEIEKLRKSFVVEREGHTAHGETIEQAINDVNFKYLQSNADVNEIINEVKKKKTVSVNEYRLLTGACSFGVSEFMKSKNITEEELPLEEVLKITENSYGGSRMRKIFR